MIFLMRITKNYTTFFALFYPYLKKIKKQYYTIVDNINRIDYGKIFE